MTGLRIPSFLILLLGCALFVTLGYRSERSSPVSMVDFKSLYYDARCLSFLVAICLIKAPIPTRIFLVFSGMILAASMASPALGELTWISPWEAFLAGPAGNRYWLIPSLAFAWTIERCAQSKVRVLKLASASLFCIMSFSSALNWQHPTFQDMPFGEYSRAFEMAPVGTNIIIPQNQPGWDLRLIKH